MSPYKKRNLLSEIYLGVSKKTEKLIKPRKLEKKKPNCEKNQLNRLKFWKNRPFGFGFISLKPKKLNWTQTGKKTEPKPSQTRITEPNRKNKAKPVWTGFCPKNPNRTKPKSIGLNRFRFGFGFFKKNWFCYFFKKKSNRKWSPLDIPFLDSVIVLGRISLILNLAQFHHSLKIFI
jgi:hypothetical protein